MILRDSKLRYYESTLIDSTIGLFHST